MKIHTYNISYKWNEIIASELYPLLTQPVYFSISNLIFITMLSHTRVYTQRQCNDDDKIIFISLTFKLY